MSEQLPAKRNELQALLNSEAIKKRFDEVLGKKAAGFMSSVISAVNANKNLKQAEPMSIIQAAAVAAALDLPVNPSLGFAFIVPYGDKATFQIGYKGLIQLGMRSGQYKLLNVCEVYEGELKKKNRFTGEMELDESCKTSDKVIGYVAYMRLINGFEKYFYMTVEQSKEHGKRYSKSYDHQNGQWKTNFVVMAQKTVIKLMLAHYGILSIEMQMAVQADQAVVKADGEYDYIDAEEVSEKEPESTVKKHRGKEKANIKEEDVTDFTPPNDGPDAPAPCPHNPEVTYKVAYCEGCVRNEQCEVYSLIVDQQSAKE
ncbi:MAG: recombinase RecT [Candidatus Margulisiibacteriota bacterium]|jgi:recombination protein RecT